MWGFFPSAVCVRAPRFFISRAPNLFSASTCTAQKNVRVSGVGGRQRATHHAFTPHMIYTILAV
jgi:hypothetical protein